jgi:hypothetical protein
MGSTQVPEIHTPVLSSDRHPITKFTRVEVGLGQTIYRARPYYYVFEQITRERVERGELLDDAPKRLIAARTPVVIESHWLTQRPGSS